MSEEALLVADIQGERARALRYYDEGIIGSGRLKAWLGKLDYQQQKRDEISDSLEESAVTIVDLPIHRDTDRTFRRPAKRQMPRIGKFARSL